MLGPASQTSRYQPSTVSPVTCTFSQVPCNDSSTGSYTAYGTDQDSHAGVSGAAAKDAQKLLMLAKGMAKKRLDNPETAAQYTKGGPESGEAIRLYLAILEVNAGQLSD